MALAADRKILGGPQVSPRVLSRFLDAKAGSLTAPEKEEIVSAFTTYGRLTSIGNLIPFAQAWHETGGFTSERWKKSLNPAGVGATNDGAWGQDFASAAEGIVAQYAHLLAYACKDENMTVPQKILVQLDPRLKPLAESHGRGCAERWVDLNGK